MANIFKPVETFRNAVTKLPNHAKAEFAKTAGKNVALVGTLVVGAGEASQHLSEAYPGVGVFCDTLVGGGMGIVLATKDKDARAAGHEARSRMAVLRSKGIDHDSFGTRLKHPVASMDADREAWKQLTKREKASILRMHAWNGGMIAGGAVAGYLSLHATGFDAYLLNNAATSVPAFFMRLFTSDSEAKAEWKQAVGLAKTQGKAKEKMDKAEKVLERAIARKASPAVIEAKRARLTEAQQAYGAAKEAKIVHLENVEQRLTIKAAEVAASTPEAATPEVITDVAPKRQA